MIVFILICLEKFKLKGIYFMGNFTSSNMGNIEPSVLISLYRIINLRSYFFLFKYLMSIITIITYFTNL